MSGGETSGATRAFGERTREGDGFMRSWRKAAAWRRSLLAFLVLLTTAVATAFMGPVVARQGWFGLELVLVVLFAVLFAWISIGFWVSMFGFFLLAGGRDRFAVTRTEGPEPGGIPEEARTAVLFPICNEEVDRVFAGLYATWRSLEQTGRIEHFDFFVLSDTADPDTWIEEEAAWAELCRELGEGARVFYRRRRVNLKRKSGNVADFCRRWGKSFRYMVVFDADSIMAGPTLVRMVQLMERRPSIGILQTAPTAVNLETLFARLQQFANHVYGPLFTAGLHFWQLGDGQYWGHNAIIRIAPFIAHCGLPRLPGKPPLGWDILSHDYVEAALMRRAGWEVWLAHELGGSYEEMPPTLLAELKRDRRWCQGNLQHLRLLFIRGISSAHRAVFLNGAMSYISALLWFVFLSVSTLIALANAFLEPDYFPVRFSLFPEWPVWNPQWALVLLGVTAVILFLPKVLAAGLVIRRKRAKDFGGRGKLWLGVVAEAVLSTLFAPIRMVFHSKFVFATLLGHQVGWGGQLRGDRPTGWREALRYHGQGMLLGLFWGTGMFLINPDFFWWLTPILLALVLSVPLSTCFSRVEAGRKFREWGLLLQPEEVEPPQELVWLREYLERVRDGRSSLGIDRRDGFRRAVVDPGIHALHRQLLRGDRKLSPAIVARRRILREKALVLGPDGLTKAEKKILLSDPAGLRDLHEQVWESTGEITEKIWGLQRDRIFHG